MSREDTTPPTVTLTERVGTVCRLAPADVDFLLAGHRAHVTVAPTGRRHHYRLTATGHVGTIVAPHCRLILRPKIPIANLFFLLDPAAVVPVVDDATTPAAATDVLDFLAAQLAHLMTQRTAAGLHRGYAERATHGPILQGRLDVHAQLCEAHPRKDRVHCRVDELTVDVPCNQVPRATGELVLRSPLLGERVRAELQRSLAPYAEAASVPLDAECFRRAAPNRLTEPYQPLLDLCWLLADSLGPGASAGPVACPAFLLNMERVFEQYVTAAVVRACPVDGRHVLAVQRWYDVSYPCAGQPTLAMRPDLTVERDGWPVRVIDAKWKSLRRSPLVTADVYQVLAYCAALKARRGVLVYPGRRNRVWRYALARAPATIEVRSLRVLGTREECRRALRSLCRAVRTDTSGG